MKKDSMALLLANTLLEKFPNPDDYPYRPWSYPQGYLMIGLSKLWKVTGEQKYYDYIRNYCEKHVNINGDVSGFTGCSMDDMMAGAILVWMYEQGHEEKYAKACNKIRAAFNDYPRTIDGGLLHNRFYYPGEMWVDGVFMGQMFNCRYGKAFDEPTCWDETIHQLDIIYRYCHKHDGLIAHAYSENCVAEWAGIDGCASEVWSEGMGWYALILAEAIDIIPANFAGMERVKCYYNELLAGLKKYQNLGIGLWHQIVDKGNDPNNWCDTSGSAMFTYAIKRAVEMGIVEEAEYLPIVQRAYQGLLTRVSVNERGWIDIHTACEGLCVQRCYDDYINYPQTVNAQEAVCGYLWAMTIMEKES